MSTTTAEMPPLSLASDRIKALEDQLLWQGRATDAAIREVRKALGDLPTLISGQDYGQTFTSKAIKILAKQRDDALAELKSLKETLRIAP